jgi:hypothetical protein
MVPASRPGMSVIPISPLVPPRTPCRRGKPRAAANWLLSPLFRLAALAPWIDCPGLTRIGGSRRGWLAAVYRELRRAAGRRAVLDRLSLSPIDCCGSFFEHVL